MGGTGEFFPIHHKMTKSPESESLPNQIFIPSTLELLKFNKMRKILPAVCIFTKTIHDHESLSQAENF